MANGSHGSAAGEGKEVRSGMGEAVGGIRVAQSRVRCVADADVEAASGGRGVACLVDVANAVATVARGRGVREEWISF